MRVSVGTGKYVVAVSGGVDSMVLLDLLVQRPGLSLTVAHFDHGIRKESAEDRKLVQKIAKNHKLPFVYHEGKLGPGTSEAKARNARYKFLDSVKTASGAKSIITAHHQDDVLETAIINLIRGSGRLGLTSLKSTDRLSRPLLGFSKAQILDYANDHKILWREDESNADTVYLRNYIRTNVLPKFTIGQRAQLEILIENMRNINIELDDLLAGLLHVQPALDEIDRAWFISLPHDISKELVHAWLRRHKAKDVSRKTIERLITSMKTGKNRLKIEVNKKFYIKVTKTKLALVHTER